MRLITSQGIFVGQDINGGTSGSIVYIDSNGQFAQDNANLFYNATDQRVGLGTAAPAGKFHLVDQTSGTSGSFIFENFNASAVGAIFAGKKARGTFAAPLRTQSGDQLARVNAYGYHAADDVSAATVNGGASGSFGFNAAEAHTGTTNWGANFLIRTTDIGSASITTRLVISDVGNILIGNNPGQPSTGTQTLVFADGTAPSGMPSNTAGVYANDVSGTVELFGIDEAGNAPQLTPHNFTLFDPEASEQTPWSQYFRQHYLGVELAVDMARLARLVQQLTGARLIYRQPLATRRDWVDDQEAAMRRAMAAYEAWAASDDPDKGSAPRVPQVKAPPAWLKTRLEAQGWLNETKAQTLRAELQAWKTARNL